MATADLGRLLEPRISDFQVKPTRVTCSSCGAGSGEIFERVGDVLGWVASHLGECQDGNYNDE